MNNMELSIIICTYNRAKLLAKCLDSIAGQSISTGYEVIVVDNNSQDNTFDTVMQYDFIDGLRYLREEHQGLSYARNAGCLYAVGKYLLYIDDDCLLPAEYIANVLAALKDYSPDIMGGPIYPWYDSPKPKWFKDEYEIRKYENESGFSTTCPVSGGNYIIRKNVLIELGMFDVTLGMKGDKIGMGEERRVLEIYRAVTPAASQRVYYSLDCWLTHYVPDYKMKYFYIFKRSYAAGLNSLAVVTTHTDTAKAKNKLKRFGGLIITMFLLLKHDGFTIANVCKIAGRYTGVIIGLRKLKMTQNRR